MKTTYEWGIEVVNGDGDIEECWFADKLGDLGKPTEGERLVLVRHVGDDLWAYPEDGKMPETFDAGGDEFPTEVRVPKRFHEEYARWLLVT